MTLADGISVNDYVNGRQGAIRGQSGSDAVEQFSVLKATTRLSTVGHPVESLALDSVRNAISTATPLSTYATARWMLEFLQTSKPPFRRNQFGGPPEDLSGRPNFHLR